MCPVSVPVSRYVVQLVGSGLTQAQCWKRAVGNILVFVRLSLAYCAAVCLIFVPVSCF